MSKPKFKINQIDRTTLYFNKWDSRVKIEVYAIGYTKYYRNSSHFMLSVKQQQETYKREGYMRDYTFQHITKDISDTAFLSNKTFTELSDEVGNKIKINRSTHSIFLYFNLSDTDTLNKILNAVQTVGLTIEQCDNITETHPDIIYTNSEPEKKYRLYSKSRSLSNIESYRSELRDFFVANPGITPSPSFDKWMTNYTTKWSWDYSAIKSSFYVEYDLPANHVLISLCFPELVGKQFQMVLRPET